MKLTPIILALLVTLSSLVGIEAKPKDKDNNRGKGQEVVYIVDQTSDAWDGVIQETVDDFNAVMPKNGPRLVYVRDSHKVCSEWRVNVCSGWSREYDEFSGLAMVYKRPREIWLTDSHQISGQGREVVACHEFMHILAEIKDNYGARPDSCVWGYLSDPGPFDIKKLQQAFSNRERDWKWQIA